MNTNEKISELESIILERDNVIAFATAERQEIVRRHNEALYAANQLAIFLCALIKKAGGRIELNESCIRDLADNLPDFVVTQVNDVFTLQIGANKLPPNADEPAGYNLSELNRMMREKK